MSDKEITLFASRKAIPNLFQQVIYTCERLEVPLIWYNYISEAKGIQSDWDAKILKEQH